MLTKEECDFYNKNLANSMAGHLGMVFLPSDDEFVWAEMPINERTCQYFGILHGGASLALAETLAGVGSRHIVGDDECKICGINVQGSHVGMSATSGVVRGKASVVHAGKTTHLWSIDILGEDDKLISTERVTNYIIRG